MQMLGLKPYQLGSIVVDELGLDTAQVYTSKFRIKHTTRITPIMLDTQWDDIQADIAPDYFFNLKCLKPVFFYEARYFATDPNNTQYLQKENILGNTGWFNENWNSNPTNYSIQNLQYLVGSTPVNGIKIDASATTKFTFDIINNLDAPFVAGSTKLVLNFNKAPNDSTEYTGNSRDLQHNFVWESATLTANTIPVAVNGDNFSDLTLKSLINLKAFFVSSTKITVIGSVQMDQLGIDVFEESDVPNYMLWLSIQNHAKQGAIADRATLLVDAKEVYYQTSFPALLGMSSKLIPHDCPNYNDSFVNRQKFSEDELVGYTKLTINRDTAVTAIEFLKYKCSILMVNTVTNDEFVVESKTVNLPPIPYLPLPYPYINITLAKPIHVPVAEIRKNIVIRKQPTLGANIYEFAYPFLNRWEYWVELLTANAAFFNLSQKKNGLNQDWQHYYVGDWIAQYRYELYTKINDVPAVYSDSINFPIYDRNLVGENTTCVVKTFDPDSLTELIDSGFNKYILGYKNTLIEATFTNIVDGFSGTDTTVVFGIEVFEEGGTNGKRRMSSKYDSDADTWFIPLSGQTRTKLTINNIGPINGNTCIAEVLIDFNSLDISKLNWKLTARIYGNDLSPSGGVITYGQNYLGSQDVKLIPTNPIDEDTIVLAPEKINCSSDLVWCVLADTTSSDPLKNDANNFIQWFNKDVVDIAVVSLVKSDGTIIPLTGITLYGTPYDYGFEIIPGVTVNGYNESAVGYNIDWKKVLTLLGEDTYYIQFDISTIFGATKTITSETYCLKQYTVDRANGTVRIEYILNGLLGKTNKDDELNDYLSANWTNQHRFSGVFHYVNSAYKTDEIMYSNGLSEFVESDQSPEYILKLKPIPAFKHNLLRTDILMADSIYITDYNTRNIENYYRKQVINSGGYDPKWYTLQSKIASVELKFKQAFNNLKKFRS